MTKPTGVNYRPFVTVNGKVYPVRKPYIARASVGGVQMHVGCFETADAARNAVSSFKAQRA